MENKTGLYQWKSVLGTEGHEDGGVISKVYQREADFEAGLEGWGSARWRRVKSSW